MTRDSHWTASVRGRLPKFIALFRAYFSEGRNVSTKDVLVDCAAAVDLDPNEARALLDGDTYAEAVRESQEQAERRGITGVPCYVFEDKHAVTGAQPVEVFAEALDTLAPSSSPEA